jgi:hypothetical protein
VALFVLGRVPRILEQMVRNHVGTYIQAFVIVVRGANPKGFSNTENKTRWPHRIMKV